jgi:hypothetical protein
LSLGYGDKFSGPAVCLSGHIAYDKVCLPIYG